MNAKNKILLISIFSSLFLSIGEMDAQSHKEHNQGIKEEIILMPTPITSGDESDIHFMKAEIMPEFPGGENALLAFIRDNTQYPATAKSQKIQGKVYCRVLIAKDGSITDPVIIKSLSPDLDKEALRILKLMPKWKPGQQRGKNVSVYYHIPFDFEL